SFLYWICYWKNIVINFETTKGFEFQSFLYWICYWKSVPNFPVYFDFAPFQSFLYWICYWKSRRVIRVGRKVLVSILLILDMLLEEYLQYVSKLKHNMRFNPSYTGYATGRMGTFSPIRITIQVSILLILDMLLEDSELLEWVEKFQ